MPGLGGRRAAERAAALFTLGTRTIVPGWKNAPPATAARCSAHTQVHSRCMGSTGRHSLQKGRVCRNHARLHTGTGSPPAPPPHAGCCCWAPSSSPQTQTSAAGVAGQRGVHARISMPPMPLSVHARNTGSRQGAKAPHCSMHTAPASTPRPSSRSLRLTQQHGPLQPLPLHGCPLPTSPQLSRPSPRSVAWGRARRKRARPEPGPACPPRPGCRLW